MLECGQKAVPRIAAKRFEVSAQTIRKDLNDLCEHRSLTRIHGGAIIASGVENLAYEANTDAIPALETAVTLILEPVVAKKK